jgi:hypothetical protein
MGEERTMGGGGVLQGERGGEKILAWLRPARVSHARIFYESRGVAGKTKRDKVTGQAEAGRK